jgi:hypothetical protein
MEKQIITIGIDLSIWKQLMQLKLDKDLKTHNDVLNYLLKKEHKK